MTNGPHTHNQLRKTARSRNALFVVTVLSLITVVYSLYVIQTGIGEQRTVLQPQFLPSSCEAWVNSFEASECYLEALAHGDAALMFSITPKNGKTVQRKMLLRTHPSAQPKMGKWIKQQVTEIREKGYHFAFFVEDTIADNQSQTVYVKGLLWNRLGNTALPDEQMTMAFRYLVTSGEAKIIDFWKVESKND